MQSGVPEGGQRGDLQAKRMQKIIWGGKSVWILIKLSEDIPWESPPPTIAYFGPSTKTKGIISFFLLKNEKFITDKILQIYR